MVHSSLAMVVLATATKRTTRVSLNIVKDVFECDMSKKSDVYVFEKRALFIQVVLSASLGYKPLWVMRNLRE